MFRASLGVALPQTVSPQFDEGLSAPDLPQAALAPSGEERCLCPSFRRKAQIARIPSGNFHSLDSAMLAGLEYSAEGIQDTDSSPGVQPGLMLAVRTVEGNFAKVLVYDVDPDLRLTLEWRVYKGDPARRR
ncbi:MAG: hypothetical protein HYY48_05055 [Gammaproteobacteria bacterium]|nr:hypothetical protein [Gammaproteobacteria bacterium]